MLLDNCIWDIKCSVGNDILDNHHKVLFDILTRCVESSDKSDVKYLMVVRELLDYCHMHFAVEENMIEENGYPYFQEHAVEHKNILSAVEKIIFKLYNGIPINVDRVDKFVFNWILRHVLEQDMKYKGYV
ncbi:hemerythrin domain-containing protein [Maridesulfovibrio sp.]|uniref:bacteriohemerythrin n=1 Tax=Maridesulfovibrio sp. TaxID=2795000 RepID=UPI0029F463D0|nr:hemerythrin domain-containing protein [Maridesulfovibrio sp.]